MVWPKFYCLIFEILVDIQNDSFGYCVVDLLWCCYNETQTRNEAKNSFCKIVLGVQMCMHYMKFMVVYKLKILLIMQQFGYLISLKTKIKNMFFHWDSNLGSLGQRSSA